MPHYAIILSSGYIPRVPIGRRVLGQAYQVQFSEEISTLSKSALLKLYLPLQLSYLTNDIAIYRWSSNSPVPRWQRVGGIRVTSLENSLIASINKPGIYVLLGTVPGEIYLPFIVK